MSYNEELQSNNYELEEILRQVNELSNGNGVPIDAVVAKYGEVFDTFPTQAQIRALPNNSFFTVKSYGVPNGETQVATYYSTRSWTRNALRYSDTDGATIYVVPVSQPTGEVYLPLYGIKTGEENAVSNSAIMDTLINIVQYGATFRFPVGHFWFSKPIDISGKHISVIGAVNAGYRHINISGTTFLHFTNLASGDIALKVSQCTVADFTLYGNESQYSMGIDRDEDSTVPNPTVNVTGNVKNYGIWASGSMIIRHIGVRNFYHGIWCDTANMSISNVGFKCCHYGLSIGNDIKVFDIFGFDIMVLLQMRGSLSSAIGVRGDSLGEHLVEITGGGNHTLVDLDADFCMGAIVAIGDGVNASNVVNLNINGVHGRSGVHHVHATSTEITAQNITADNAGEFGVLAVENASSLKGAVIITNQSKNSSPYDSVSGFRTPFVLLSAGGGTSVQGVQIFTTSDDELTEAWVKKRIASCSALANACSVKVYTSKGTINYTRHNSAVIVTDDASDIYQRMDKSALARKDEIILTVNGIAPDADGNVEVTEQEPEVVQSEDEFTDTSKKYVLPDGYIYAYRKKFIKGGSYPNFTNQLPISLNPLNENEILDGVGYRQKVKWKLSDGVFTENAMPSAYSNGYTTGLIPVKPNDVIRINMLGYHTTVGMGEISMFMYTLTAKSGTSSLANSQLSKIIDGGGKYTTTGQYGNGMLSDVEIHLNYDTVGWVANEKTFGYAWFNILNTTPPDSVIITVNEEITYTTVEDHYEWDWERTGDLYVKPDYLGMIAALEERVRALENK